MRFHKRYPLLQLWLDIPQSRSALSAGSLAVVRYEPAVSRGGNAAFLDLVFSDAQTIAVLPYVEVDTVMLLERGRTPLIWPDAARSLGYGILEEIERKILPWLESRTLARQANAELIQYFSGAIDKQRFEAARSARFLGASPYVECMAAFAPYAYALRFCEEKKPAGIADPHGASGAALLASRGFEVKADLGDSGRNELAALWFGREMFGSVASSYALTVRTPDATLPPGEADLALDRYNADPREVHVASPVPNDVLVSFDVEDAPRVRSFGVSLRQNVPLRSPAAVIDTPVSGGSAGTILMILRDGFASAGDSDSDEANALAQRLRAEGFTAELSGASAVPRDFHADLVHVLGLEALEQSSELLRHYRSLNVPVVATPAIPRIAREDLWSPQLLRSVFARSPDEAVLQERLDLMELRRLNTEAAAPAPQSSALDAYVDVAIAATAAEEIDLRERYGFHGEIVRSAPYLRGADVEAARIHELAGTRPFAFVHAPVEWRTNLTLLARVAAGLNVPIVVAGRTVDVDALHTARAQAPELLVHLPEVKPEEVTALYRTARVFVDLSWGPRGSYRVARALVSGCAVVASKLSYASETWPGSVFEADPGSESSIAHALQGAWNSSVGCHGAANAGEAFSAAIFAYAKAQQARVPA